ncbi:hypothetical protein HFO93_07030 [Rhizobium leguminosarum]|uniref:hypothetical protein n=1 Tax=Rhizobium leguminosarum TaxID=384 RepID=UPI001C98C9A4|nr:hypothetical protein [Rhizobium leguminosarum]MBY5443232.1 hypothetical protein [Rhizobium leguminosarum]
MNLPTLALWYQRNHNHSIKEKSPVIDLHVNLWRRIEESINYLDIGIKIVEQRDVGSLNLYVPFSRSNCKVSDLAHLLKKKEISSAVFNEVLEVEPLEGSDTTFYIRQNDKHFLSIHQIDVETDIEYIEGIAAEKFDGFVVRLKRDFCSKFQMPGDHYVRFRFDLNGESARVFSSNVSNEDGWILSSITSSEITEIRVNEVRSIPEPVQRLSKLEAWLQPTLQTIHYFLVRDIKFDLVASHASFRKIRRMEPEWDEYVGFPEGSARNMLIYHWRASKDGGGSVGDFVTLAKFRRSKDNVKLYILLVVALGSIGSGIHSSLSFGTKSAAVWVSGNDGLLSDWPGWEAVAATVILLLFFYGIAARALGWRPWKKKATHLSE